MIRVAISVKKCDEYASLHSNVVRHTKIALAEKIDFSPPLFNHLLKLISLSIALPRAIFNLHMLIRLM